jgi:amino acid transporter
MNAPAGAHCSSQEVGLRRTIGPIQIMFYGVGGMLGAGIYTLIGDTAKTMGNAVWLAFFVSMIGAMLTGLSYACIGSRYPKAAGAAYAADRAYRTPMLTYVVGLAVVASGLTSMATGSRLLARELTRAGIDLPVEILAIAFLVVIGSIVLWGIRECMWLNILCTTVEILGLIFVIGIGMKFIGSVNYLQGPPVATDGGEGYQSITFAMVFAGAIFTFYAFIGFEDILNVAEEVKKPSTSIPIGLIGAMVITTVVYMTVAIVAVSALDHSALVGGGLRAVVAGTAPWFPTWLFTVIVCFAVSNTVLLNFIMGSRLIYGMSRQGLMPRVLGSVQPWRRTPHVAILTVLLLIILMMLIGHIEDLASATVLLLLGVFSVVNLGLVVLKLRAEEPRGAFEVPLFVPILGAITCATLLVSRLIGGTIKAPILAGSLVVGIVLLYFVMRPNPGAIERPSPAVNSD